MDKQKKQFIALCLFLVVCVCAYFGLKVWNDQKEEKEQQKTEEETVTAVQVDSEKVTSFSYQADGTELTFEKEEDIWYYQPDHSINIDQNGIDSMLSAVETLTTTEKIDSPEDIAEYGLDTPENVLKFNTGDGTYTVTLGMKNEITSQYYVLNSDSDTVYLIDTDLSSVFSKTVEELTAEEETEDGSTTDTEDGSTEDGSTTDAENGSTEDGSTTDTEDGSIEDGSTTDAEDGSAED